MSITKSRRSPSLRLRAIDIEAHAWSTLVCASEPQPSDFKEAAEDSLEKGSSVTMSRLPAR